ncbi:MAG: GNAT family N-acetyltransferase [Microbacteriaceae bacterium]|nr:GNAT family N-acetyltransferase [Microbacteriaceae bacterium]
MINELAIPANLAAEIPPGSSPSSPAADFIEMTRVRNEIEAEMVGSDDLAVEPGELLPGWLDHYSPKRLFVARVDGRIVARGIHEAQSGDSVRSAWLSVEVLSAYRRQGIGTALHRRVAEIARSEGRTVLQSFVLHVLGGGGERIDSPTGFGSVSAHDDSTRFLLSHGYRLAQVERMSRLILPLTFGLPSPAPGYDLLFWRGPTPAERRAQLAVLHAGMSTDVPLGELDYEPEEWDATRVKLLDERTVGDGRRMLTVAARHRASDTLVGFTQLSVPVDDARAVFQENTIVVGAHRGHGLGLAMKLENLTELRQAGGAFRHVYTWNAEENRHMLAVNEALGFEPVGYSGSWRREL